MSYTRRGRLRARAALRLGAAFATISSAASTARAQSGQDTETVIVTGSRLPQQGLTSSRPVTAFDSQELKFEGTLDVTTLINQLPEVFADQNSTISNGAKGTANVDLRGLGAKRTLVTINGTRLMPGDPTDPVPDLEDIPAALVDHIEVLTGGASTVYGSDALAGVVNFIMRKDFEGIEIDGTATVQQAPNDNGALRARLAEAGDSEPPENVWDGAAQEATLILGSSDPHGRGNITAWLGYRSEQPVQHRDFSACPLETTFVPFNPSDPTDSGLICSGSSNYDSWISIDRAVRGQPYDFFETGSASAGSGRFVPFTGSPDQVYNYGPENYLRRPDRRYVGGFFAHYAENRELEAYANFMFSDDDTVAQVGPSGLFLGVGAVSGSEVEVNCSNPLLTEQERTTLCGANGSGASNLIPGQALLAIGRRVVEAEDRVDELRHTAFRLQTGVRGDLGSGWSYDIYGQLGMTLYGDYFRNDFSIARVQRSLQVDPKTGACYAAEPDAQGIIVAPACIPLNVFDGFGSVTPAMANYIYADAFAQGFTREQILSGSLTGDLGEWGGRSPLARSPIGLSLGAEWRSESLLLNTSSEYATGDLYGQGGAELPVPLSGFEIAEGFGEVDVPLIEGAPLAESLSVNAGYRYGSYSTAGAVTSYKYGLEWQPVGDIRLRGLFERAVRAPNVLELFTPATLALFIARDPCSTSDSGRCAKVPNAGTVLLRCPDNQCELQNGGNPMLAPEKSNTGTIGIVLTPRFLDGFTTTIDWFNIRVDGYVSTIDPGITLAGCYGAGATGSSENYFCPLVHRNALGQIFGGGYVNADAINTGFLSTTGIDLESNYTADLSDWGLSGAGSLDVNLLATWLDTLINEPVPGQGSYDCAGLFGVVCGEPAPRWRHKARATWTTPWNVVLSLAWRHYGAVHFDGNTGNPLLNAGCFGPCGDIPDNRISPFDYFDIAVDWPLRTGLDLRAGVNNVFAKEPPVVDSLALGISGDTVLSNVNTYPGMYDALGRTIFVATTLNY